MEGIEKLKKYLENTEELEEIGSGPEYERIERMHVLMTALLEGIEEEDRNDREKCAEVDKWAEKVINEGTRFIKESKNSECRVKVAEMIKEAYQINGRRSFEHFLVAIEWNFNKDMKFYDIRKNVLKDWVEELQKLEDGKYKGLSISAPPRTGKALSMDSKILTPTGWKLMRDIKEGDYAIGADGKKAKIIGVFPQGITDMYRVCFEDGTSVKCSGDHLWEVRTIEDRPKGKSRIMKTTDMVGRLTKPCGMHRYSTLYVEPIEFKDRLKEDDLDPYLLGALLSERSFGINRYAPFIEEKLKEYKLKGKTCDNKFIPDKYKYSSIENRKKLIKGILKNKKKQRQNANKIKIKTIYRRYNRSCKKFRNKNTRAEV